MNRNCRPRLHLEHLETRLCPALTMRLMSGTLFITGSPVGDLAVTEKAANAFQVTDGGKSLGTYSSVSNINLNLSSHTDKKIDFDFGGLRLGGNLYINEGLGFQASPGTTGTGLRNGSIGGSVTVVGGSGDESLNLGLDSAAANPAALTVGGDVTFSPHVNSNVGGFRNIFLAGQFAATPPVTIGGSVSLNNVGNILLGVSATVGRNLSVSAGVGQPETFFDVGTVKGNLSVSSVGTAANVALGFGALLPATVQGSVSVNLGSGNDSFSFAAGSTIGASANIATGGGDDSVNLDGAVGGDLTVNAGDGTDTITSAAVTGTVAGNMSVTAGSGNDSVTLDGSVSGNLNITLGNGDDTVTIGNAPGGVLHWTSGNGNDSVTLGDGTTMAGEVWNVHMQFGTGNDTLALAGPATQTLTGFIDMGGPPGGNSFDPTGQTGAGTWVIVSPFTLQNV